MNYYLPIAAAVIALLIWGGTIMSERRAKRVSVGWIVSFTLSCFVASVLVSIRPTFQGLTWLSLKEGVETAQGVLAILKEYPIATILYLHRWDFLVALFPATVAVVASLRARNFRSKTIRSIISIYLSFAIVDVLLPVRIAGDPPTWFLLVSDLILGPVFGVSIVYLSQVINELSFPETVRQWCQKHSTKLLIFCIFIGSIIVVSLPFPSRVHLVFTDWEGVTLRYLGADPRFNLYSVIGQIFNFSPLPQRSQWVFVSAKDNTLDLSLTKDDREGGGPIQLEIYRVDFDWPAQISYLLPKFKRDQMRRPPRLVYTGEVFPGSMKISEPSLNCWLYNQGQGVEDTNFVFSLEAPLNTPITISKERGGSEDAKPPLSDQPPSNTVFDIHASGKRMGFFVAGGQINIFCHGSNSYKQTSHTVQITAKGLPKAIVMEPDWATSNVDGKPDALYPGFLLRLGKQNQHVFISSENSEMTFRVATPSFNLGQVAIGDLDAKGLRGILKIDADSRALDAGDEVSIYGQDLTISTGARGEVIIEGQTTEILHNGVDESKRVWMVIPSDVRTILISIVTSLITGLLLWRFKR